MGCPTNRSSRPLTVLVAAKLRRWACITGPMPVLSMYGSGNSMAKENVL